MKQLFIFVSLALWINLGAFTEDSSSLFDDIGNDNQPIEQTDKASESTAHLKLRTDIGVFGSMPLDADNFDLKEVARQPGANLAVEASLVAGIFKIQSNWQYDVAVNPNNFIANQYALESFYRGYAGDNYIGIIIPGFKLNLGYQSFAWGSADGINPTDIINHIDYSRGLRTKKLSDLSVDLNFYPIDGLHIELIYLPVDAMDFYDRDIAGELSAKLGKPVSIADPSYSINSMSFAGRLRYTSANFDIALSYGYLLDDYFTPIYNLPSAGPFLLNNVELFRSRVHNIGLDFKTTLDKFGLWMEGNYSFLDGYIANQVSLRGPELKAILGMDAQLGPGDAIYTNLQFGSTYRPFYDKKTSSDFGDPTSYVTTNIMNSQKISDFYYRSGVQSLGGQTEELLLTGMLTLKSSLFDGVFNPLMTFVYNFPIGYDDTNYTRQGSFLTKIELDFMPIDSFHIKIGTELAYAWYTPNGGSVKFDRSIDSLGFLTENNRIYLEFNYSWVKDIDL